MTEDEFNKAKKLHEAIDKGKNPYKDKAKRREVIRLIKRHTEEYGSCRVGWAAKEVFGKEQENHVHDKLAGLITRFGYFTKERNELFPKDWNIYRNPGFMLSVTSIIVTIVFSLAATTIAYLNYKKKNDTKVYLIKEVPEKDTAILLQSGIDTVRSAKDSSK